MSGLIFFLACGLISGFIGYLISKRKGRGCAGFWWSFFLGGIGWIVAACLEPSEAVLTRRMATQARMIKEACRD